MKTRVISVLAIMAAFVLIAASQPPGGGRKGDKGDKGEKGEKGEKGDRKGPPRWELGKVLPPFVRDQLELTEEQQKQIATLEKDVKDRLLKILTTDQKDMLEKMRNQGPPRPGGPGPDGEFKKGKGKGGPPPGRIPDGD